MTSFILNIDVPCVEAGANFYTAAFGLNIGRGFGSSVIELLGAETKIYLLERRAGTSAGPGSNRVRRYERHWSPIHWDFVVQDMDEAVAKALDAGAIQESETRGAVYGKIAMFADPFGHGFCLIEFNAQGYDALNQG
ncbi:VOC family protein [Pacificimonas flava]|uniref:VOC family protein n=1 Tax=Pacificimonas flava TaxID=1234595 RepID=UPI00057047BD|nr:VOC family protein [Pacificimonas flava]MBB5279685.1 putative enzyme related to lactoylglutathione lyase [Pacificimonas flava]